MIAPVMSLAQLQSKAYKDSKYKDLAIRAAENLGETPGNLTEALELLRQVADETSEDEVVEEVNFLRSEI